MVVCSYWGIEWKVKYIRSCCICAKGQYKYEYAFNIILIII